MRLKSKGIESLYKPYTAANSNSIVVSNFGVIEQSSVQPILKNTSLSTQDHTKQSLSFPLSHLHNCHNSTEQKVIKYIFHTDCYGSGTTGNLCLRRNIGK